MNSRHNYEFKMQLSQLSASEQVETWVIILQRWLRHRRRVWTENVAGLVIIG